MVGVWIVVPGVVRIMFASLSRKTESLLILQPISSENSGKCFAGVLQAIEYEKHRVEKRTKFDPERYVIITCPA